MTSSNRNIFRVTGPLWGEFTGEFPSQRPVTRSFDVFSDLSMNKRLSKQSWGWGFETPSRPLWRHCNVLTRVVTFVQVILLYCSVRDNVSFLMSTTSQVIVWFISCCYFRLEPGIFKPGKCQNIIRLANRSIKRDNYAIEYKSYTITKYTLLRSFNRKYKDYIF